MLLYASPKNALKNALYVGYSTPNKKPKVMLPKEIQDDQSSSSDETLDHLEVYQQLGKNCLEFITIFTFKSDVSKITKEPLGFLLIE